MSWNIVSRSRGGAAGSPSSVSSDVGSTDAVLPASTLSRSLSEARRDRPARSRRGGFGGDEVLVAGERRAARADRSEQDLVLLERRRLEHDAHAVGQRPLGDPERVRSSTCSTRARATGSGSSSGCVLTVSTYAVSGRRRRCRGLMTAASFASSGIVGLSASGALIATMRLRSGIQSLASALTSASVISGRKRWLQPYS